MDIIIEEEEYNGTNNITFFEYLNKKKTAIISHIRLMTIFHTYDRH